MLAGNTTIEKSHRLGHAVTGREDIDGAVKEGLASAFGKHDVNVVAPGRPTVKRDTVVSVKTRRVCIWARSTEDHCQRTIAWGRQHCSAIGF